MTNIEARQRKQQSCNVRGEKGEARQRVKIQRRKIRLQIESEKIIAKRK